jgi:putative flippase GtrA
LKRSSTLCRKAAIVDGRLARFLLVGMLNTAVGLLVIFSAKALSADDVSANVIGYSVGLALSFVLNKRWTFGFSGDALPSLVRFLSVFAVAYLANLTMVLSSIAALGVDPYWAQALGVIPYTLIFYAGSRWYAFPTLVADDCRRDPG